MENNNIHDLRVPTEINNFAATGFYACCANCKTACSRKRPENEKPNDIADLSIYCKDYEENV